MGAAEEREPRFPPKRVRRALITKSDRRVVWTRWWCPCRHHTEPG